MRACTVVMARWGLSVSQNCTSAVLLHCGRWAGHRHASCCDGCCMGRAHRRAVLEQPRHNEWSQRVMTQPSPALLLDRSGPPLSLLTSAEASPAQHAQRAARCSALRLHHPGPAGRCGAPIGASICQLALCMPAPLVHRHACCLACTRPYSMHHDSIMT